MIKKIVSLSIIILCSANNNQIISTYIRTRNTLQHTLCMYEEYMHRHMFSQNPTTDHHHSTNIITPASPTTNNMHSLHLKIFRHLNRKIDISNEDEVCKHIRISNEYISMMSLEINRSQ